MFCHGDTSRADDCRQAVRHAVAKFGGIDAVFANAGIHQSNTLLNISDADLRRIIDINIYGTVHTLQAAVPELIRRGGGAVVINCSDQWMIGKPNSFAYGLTKGALGQITRSLSIDLAPHGIRVNAVCPSTIDTPILHRALHRSAERTGIPYEQLLKEECALFAPAVWASPKKWPRWCTSSPPGLGLLHRQPLPDRWRTDCKIISKSVLPEMLPRRCRPKGRQW